jgi:hypothetical protein
MSTPTTIGRNMNGRQANHMYGATPNDSVEGFYDTYSGANPKRVFQSNRLVGEYDKFWIGDKRMKATRWNDMIVGMFILAGLCGAGVIGYFTVSPYVQKEVCNAVTWTSDQN